MNGKLVSTTWYTFLTKLLILLEYYQNKIQPKNSFSFLSKIVISLPEQICQRKSILFPSFQRVTQSQIVSFSDSNFSSIILFDKIPWNFPVFFG